MKEYSLTSAIVCFDDYSSRDDLRIMRDNVGDMYPTTKIKKVRGFMPPDHEFSAGGMQS